jgi:hypothetical protein
METPGQVSQKQEKLHPFNSVIVVNMVAGRAFVEKDLSWYWTKEEDEKLLTLKQQHNDDWPSIIKGMGEQPGTFGAAKEARPKARWEQLQREGKSDPAQATGQVVPPKGFDSIVGEPG